MMIDYYELMRSLRCLIQSSLFCGGTDGNLNVVDRNSTRNTRLNRSKFKSVCTNCSAMAVENSSKRLLSFKFIYFFYNQIR